MGMDNWGSSRVVLAHALQAHAHASARSHAQAAPHSQAQAHRAQTVKDRQRGIDYRQGQLDNTQQHATLYY
eukprot:3889116-Alexandrium_andersonii.AAC.1